MQLVAGRGFSRDYLPATGHAFILNERAAQMTGWEDPIGETIHLEAGSGTVVGVVKDFHYESLHHAVGPLLIYFPPDQNRYMPIRLSAP